MNPTRGLIIAMAAAFLVGTSTGLVAGIALMRFGLHEPPPFSMMPPWMHGAPRLPPGPPGPPEPPGPGHLMLLHHLEDQLGLTAAQRERVMDILERVRDEREAERESVHVRIERELTPEQRRRWRDLQDRYETRWGRRPGRPGRRDDRP